jgi:hypothetical protein
MEVDHARITVGVASRSIINERHRVRATTATPSSPPTPRARATSRPGLRLGVDYSDSSLVQHVGSGSVLREENLCGLGREGNRGEWSECAGIPGKRSSALNYLATLSTAIFFGLGCCEDRRRLDTGTESARREYHRRVQQLFGDDDDSAGRTDSCSS